MGNSVKAIIFDLGGVLIDWNPEYLYRSVFEEPADMRRFLQDICTPQWNEEQDAGRSLQEGTELLVKQHPAFEAEIRAYYGRWEEMLGEPLWGTVDVLKKLREEKKYGLYALTNWSHETYPVALKKFDFLHWFDGVVVSGLEKTRKPFAAFYRLLLDRYHLTASETIFIDDNLRNVEGAAAVGIDAIHFTGAPALRAALEQRGIFKK